MELGLGAAAGQDVEILAGKRGVERAVPVALAYAGATV